MAISLSGYEEFLGKFRTESGDPLLDYWTDVIHVMRWNVDPLVEARFKEGLLVWGIWAMLKITCSRNATTRLESEDYVNKPLQQGFRLLPTPAHRDSLLPVIEAAEPKSLRIFGEEAGITNLPQISLSFPRSLEALGFRDRMAALLKAVRSHRRIATILSRCIPVEQRLPDGFHPRLLEQIFTMELGLARLRREERPLRSVHITYELAPDSKALVLWARETGANVFHVMHGQRLPTYQLTMATDLVLLSKIDEAWFRLRVDPGVRIHANGHPRLERIRRLVSATPARTGRILPRIAFFSQPAEGEYTYERRDADWKILAGLVGKAEVRIRLHPRESKEQALLALERIGAKAFKTSDAGLEEDLCWCDAIASSWSTVGMEAAACGRGIFWTCATPELYEASQELRDHGIGILVSDPAEWQFHLDQWAIGPWRVPILVPEERLVELGLIGVEAQEQKQF